jgi:UDP-N-acetylglucosamine diphosphorylase / glucose-1-phosphate thymidylyltransferase / UDP-N-acetylgalactosamine diphosphorylase / glucosamine-1-phosphate N-acetyltransferase / galactosamine-1-phosphate N-acetyltransferase
MNIIVLAGGQGKRMWPIQTDKCLIPFLGHSLLHHNLKKIKESIEGEFVIIASPSSKEGVEKVASELELNHKVVVQKEPKGMADALLSAKEHLEGEILVVNAEDVLDPEVYREVSKGGVDVMVVGKKMDQYFPGGYLKIDGDKVAGIVEKPGEGNELSDLVKFVVDYFRDGKKLVEYLENAKSEKDDVYEKALDQMIYDGLDVKFAKYDGVWIPLKYPWQILDILEHLLQDVEKQISPSSNVSDKAIIEGKVVIEDGARVFEGATIKGPCYIGKNVIVGNDSFVRESNLEEGCVTGFNSDITRSYIGANSWFHTNYIGDSVIEGDFGMGSGAVLANLRLDDNTIRVGVPAPVGAGQGQLDSRRHKLGLIAGKGSRVGVNASTMPGARIGSNSLVGPGVILHGDVLNNKKVLVKQELEISEHTSSLTSYEQFRKKFNPPKFPQAD